MDSAPSKSNTIDPAFTLSPRQEQLLFAALNSNKHPSRIDTSSLDSTKDFAMAPGSFTESPLQAPGSGTLDGFQESPFIDYDYEFEADGSFDNYDFSNESQAKMIGNLPGTSSDGGNDGANDADVHDKRSHPDDDDEDDGGGGKRREGDEKGSKKPGRKPLTSEPTSKRKAQNRAAQRAFRERKEKHLKDLETKVEDLEKASESANHENSILRAQIEKMSVELREYRKRFSLTGGTGNGKNPSTSLPAYLSGKGLGNASANNPSDVNFQFEFPRFGRLPGPAINSTSLNAPTRSSASPIDSQHYTSPVERGQISPRNQSAPTFASNASRAAAAQTHPRIDGGDMSSLSGLFSPSILNDVGKSPPFEFFNVKSNTNGSRSSTDSANGNNSTGHNTSYSSPSASSNSASNHGPSSSCGTSPEPINMQSPGGTKPADSTLTTIGEENSGAVGEGELTFCDKLNMACGNPNNPIPRTMSESKANSGLAEHNAFDVNGIDWFAQQNGNQFDPQLFGDYREPQDNIISGEGFSDSFFTEAFALPEFNSPYNMAPSPAAAKKDLVEQIDASLEDDDIVPGEDTSAMLNCNTIWDRLQACPKVKDGDFDLNLLCKDLQKKAKCSETGAVVNESDFNKIMKSYVDSKAVEKTA